MLSNFEFKYPGNIGFFALAIAAAIFFAMAFQKKERIMGLLRLTFKVRLKALRTLLLFLSLGLMAFSLIGPQAFVGYSQAQKTGIDIYVLMDTSKSMLVQDIMPDRISIAKKIISDLLDQLEGDRIGFIPFASDAYIQMPLTDDYPLARMFLDVMDTDMISGGGTNLASAIRLANASFDAATSADRVILIISDGEEHDQASQRALEGITDEKVRIYTIGVGTEMGGLVPVYGSDGRTIVDYMKDESGNPATSRLNADTLKALSEKGGGAYYRASAQGVEIKPFLDELNGLERKEHVTDRVRMFNQLYQYFLGPAILLFLIVWFIPERRAAA